MKNKFNIFIAFCVGVVTLLLLGGAYNPLQPNSVTTSTQNGLTNLTAGVVSARLAATGFITNNRPSATIGGVYMLKSGDDALISTVTGVPQISLLSAVDPGDGGVYFSTPVYANSFGFHGPHFGNGAGLTNLSIGVATNSGTATDGQALVKAGNNLAFGTVAGGNPNAITNNNAGPVTLASTLSVSGAILAAATNTLMESNMLASAFLNDTDTDMWLTLRSGNTARMRAYLSWLSYDGSNWEWLVGRNRENAFVIFDALASTHKWASLSGQATYISSAGANAVIINDNHTGGFDDIAGTGGFAVRSGGVSPTNWFAVTSGGITLRGPITVNPSAYNAASSLNILGGGPDTSQTAYLYFSDKTAGTTAWFLGKHDVDNDFRIYNSTAGAYSLHIGATDNKVGIGTLAPVGKLDVNGEVRVDSMTVSNTLSADALSVATNDYSAYSGVQSNQFLGINTVSNAVPMLIPTNALDETFYIALKSGGQGQTNKTEVAPGSNVSVTTNTTDGVTLYTVAATAGSGLTLSTERTLNLSNVTTLVETAIATNSHTLYSTNDLALETWLTISGSTNYAFQHWDTYFRAGQFAYSNTISGYSNNASMTWARWATNHNGGGAVLYVKAGLTNQDSVISVKSTELFSTNGVVMAGGGGSCTVADGNVLNEGFESTVPAGWSATGSDYVWGDSVSDFSFCDGLGSKTLKAYTGDTANLSYYTYDFGANSQSTRYFRFYLKVNYSNKASTDTDNIWQIGEAAATSAQTKVQLRNLDGTQYALRFAGTTTADVNISTNTVYRVEIKTGYNITAEMRVYDTSGSQITGSPVTQTSAVNLEQRYMSYGVVWKDNSKTTVLHMDGVGVSSTDYLGQ